MVAQSRSIEQLAEMRAAPDASNENAGHEGARSRVFSSLSIVLFTGSRYFTDIMTHLDAARCVIG
ncbi:hypothetical protein FBY09_14525 [Pseudomonas sp. SJZ101]|nr:hypothetical protein FBY00_14625 [Pseudomonas sp. SJZ075]TWC26705.1 hypothetical protein FBY02_14725 [Pseudomonas sp. SJZ078]TWC45838.1 hypothetical protein FBY11_1469 [Pseudomonas sp. SJZ124]TWC46101.1 hypothetical protein FBY04_1332 [Pseudomonas sp. SJZ080]TWC81147.1 hypothetical protein FBY09_14525 [Pseudomonas sp. SJZ101]